ncbi:S1C family serine protease [Clostridium sp. MSJ-8]|uniref:S1C family serine protease n=1 Tax=Clostridium sp. MSJ-8 TaxID=2841510 RepID=UPI00209C76EE|nr:trypsin-like peptidase domain-containing protein [Clostridium sp. MSJ-8]
MSENNNNNIYSNNENNNVENNEEALNNSTSTVGEDNSEESTYPSGYQQDDMYYNRTNTNSYNEDSTSGSSYNQSTSNESNNMNYSADSNKSSNNHKSSFKDKFKKKPKAKKVKIKKSNGKSKKVAKTCAAVAGVVIIAFGGGIIGGYLANTKAASSNGTNTTKTVSASDYAPAEFLNSSTDNDSTTLTAAEAIEKVKPAVVTISTKTIVSSSNSIFSSGQQEEQEGIGSGFIINEEGYILTNYHVVEGSTEVKVLLSTGEEVDATVVNYDEEKDIAMVKLADGTKVPGVAELGNSDAVYAGEEVIAIGTPLSKEFSATSTKGIVSAVNRDVETDTGTTMNLIQTDAAINPGNSGGPLINTKGQVIGINSMKIVVTEVEGIGFAIPINEASDRIETLSKPIITLGISIIEITDDLAKKNDLPLGLYVQDVTDFSAAQKAGIKIGDVITEFNGTRIKTADDLSTEKEKLNVGDTVKVVVERNDKEVTLEMTLE